MIHSPVITAPENYSFPHEFSQSTHFVILASNLNFTALFNKQTSSLLLFRYVILILCHHADDTVN